ncbi:protein FAM114A2 isoform X2 [Adelges cooleyi]|uniref:protein FAM114A2 isoform X2 n=1 Tax=Adelges cooleyi TaxID=133065 RepID=UPI00218042C1|nr:protein FAM114A2 isoform X2 [Adelges cooleyi]
MSDSDGEFESADEDIKGNQGWEVESDLDLSDNETSVKNVNVVKNIPEHGDPSNEKQQENCSEESSIQTAENIPPRLEKFDSSNEKSNHAKSEQPSSPAQIEKLSSQINKLTVDESSNSSQQPPDNQNRDSENEPKATSVGSSQNSGGWGGWSSSWSVNSIISTASALTNQVSQGLTNVIDASIGAPAPEELASVDRATTKTDEHVENSSESILGANYFLNNVSQFTKIVESTGSKIITGGLDTLETVGKKTLEVLQEGDPGLRKKRALFFQNSEKINLSQVLQEAKEKAEIESKHNNQENEIVKGYAYMFDQFQGLIHLESLELISKQCQMKLQTVLLTYSGSKLTDIQDELEHIKELCYLECDDDEKLMDSKEFQDALSRCTGQFNFDIKTNKIIRVSEKIEEKSCTKDSVDSVHDDAIAALAELTATAMEVFYKLGEMLMIDTEKQQVSQKAEALTLLNEAICCRIRSVAYNYACLLTKLDAASTSNQISDIYLESSNSSSYIQDAAQLLTPILQLYVI